MMPAVRPHPRRRARSSQHHRTLRFRQVRRNGIQTQVSQSLVGQREGISLDTGGD